jgi:hypothetical protein
MNKYFHTFLLTLTTYSLFGQSPDNLKLPEPKRFIDRIEVFAGPNLSFNYGNIFIENYRGEYADNNYVVNKRLLKPGYQFGVGVYHPLANRIDLNVRVLFERKGTKNELNNPLNPVNDDTRQISKDDYNYSYFTANASPNFYLGHKRKWSTSFGIYYSRIKNLSGSSKSYNTRDYQVNKGSFEGRYFYHLREDGGMDGFSWNPFLTSIETYDYGAILSVSYEVFVGESHSMIIQLQDNFGLKNINKNNPYGYKEKNHTAALIIIYNFKLSPKR